jgi:hypothetical protein
MNQPKYWQKELGILIAVAGVLALAPPAQGAVVDSFIVAGSTIIGAGGPCMFAASDELTQFVNLSCTGLNLTGGGGVVVLLEPAFEPSGSVITNPALLRAIGMPEAINVSDVFALSTLNEGQLSITFASDGATDAQLNDLANAITQGRVPRRFRTITEDGTLQNVGDFFGRNANGVQVGSDVAPEPSTWVLIGTVLPCLCWARLRSKRRKSATI